MASRIGQAVLIAFLVLAASTAQAKDVPFSLDLEFTGGGLVSFRTSRGTGPSVVGGGAGEINLRLLWRVGRRVRLGARAAVGVGGMEWGYTGADGEYAWVPGEREKTRDAWNPPPYGLKTTVAVVLAPTIVVDLGGGVALDFTMGLGGVMPAAPKSPSVTAFGLAVGAGLSVDVARFRTVTLGLTARADYMTGFWGAYAGTLVPQAGLRMTF